MGKFNKRIQRWRAKSLKLSKSWLWGAAAINHMLIDAPIPKARLPETGTKAPGALISRIAKAYKKAEADFSEQAPSMWDEISERQRVFVQALADGDHPTLTNCLENLFVGNLAEGMGYNHRSITNGWRPDIAGLRMTDNLLSLAEALAAIPLPTHAQMKIGEYLEHTNWNQDELMRLIEGALGFSLSISPAGRPPTFEFGGVETSMDLVRHAYVINRMKQIGISAADRILEIGGGIGAVAMMANRAGFQHYRIVDLPYVNAIQGYWISENLDENRVSLYGETVGPIRIAPPNSIKDISDKSIDLVVNIDSLPEMGRRTAINYLEEIRRVGKRFLSINQESRAAHGDIGPQNWVPELVERVGGFRRLSRGRYWIGEGYAEELYELV